MRIGTKSLLFGYHQFILHPIFVTMAWKKLYNRWPSFKELCGIIVHDWGYWGKCDMDGAEGETHPELGAYIMQRLFDPCENGIYKQDTWKNFSLHHSKRYADKYGDALSELYWPDKYSFVLMPNWLIILADKLTHEFDEYRSVEQPITGTYKSDNLSDYIDYVKIKTFDMLKKKFDFLKD